MIKEATNALRRGAAKLPALAHLEDQAWIAGGALAKSGGRHPGFSQEGLDAGQEQIWCRSHDAKLDRPIPIRQEAKTYEPGKPRNDRGLPMTQLDAIRELVQRRIEELGLDYATVSRRLGKNHAYIQQYLKRNNPAKLPEEVREALADVLGVDEATLKPGPALARALIEAQNLEPTKDNVVKLPSKTNGDSIQIRELDVRAYAGDGAAHLADVPDIRRQWQLPREMIKAHTSAPQEKLRIITVFGDSMEPTLQPGARVLIDTDDRSPSPPGMFVCWDGLGLVIKRVELIAHSDPLTVRLSSDNPRYAAYERTIDEAHINGRVIGRWAWS